ncbi:Predicted metal-dependent phosphoesterase TrpH, contains PHP domain [Pseudovibrio denitrificans]|uniref:Predicted metal-dependent phosphoesterase TrpH, contains PHP domain n=1 Tax=Pseudovibrio denitrificans TaxID=258256 RepID=A0A1I6XNG3_9HYPH|nr:CehA/McbA family metallohydrolase [Pseudovibrio denitrificans]SFT39511.1 Predicted metal-dependent phosphoesterase TrpH, contains PHP domain [Pseudovibrio denitrificans]
MQTETDWRLMMSETLDHLKLHKHITKADQAADPYFYLEFEVPEGTTRFDVSLEYPKAEDCIIDLGCLDPDITPFPASSGFRGWSGGARDSFFIALDDATPGYVHGKIEPGTWQIILGLYKVPETGADVELTISFDQTPRKIAPQPVTPNPVRQGAGWYKGDLHCHTFHSDARGGPELLHAAAKQAGLDFLAVADHNTTTQRRYFHPQSSEDLVFVRGMEVTTAVGHANVFGIDDWLDFRMTQPDHAHIVAKAAHDRGGLFSINHDKPPIDWTYELPETDCMEVWQSAWLMYNWVSLARYQKRLSDGLRVSLIGGSDFHQPDRLLPEGPLVLARPTTVLWLEELSEQAVLDAMKAGLGYVTEGPDGPHLSLTSGMARMGEEVSADTASFSVHVEGANGDLLRWVDASGCRQEVLISGDTVQLSFNEPVTGFLRAEIVAKANHQDLLEEFLGAFKGKKLPLGLSEEEIREQPIIRALSNPIYIKTE